MLKMKQKLLEAAMGEGAAAGGGSAAGAAAAAAGQGGGQGAANATWYGELPATAPTEFREWVTNKQFKDPTSALESQYNLEKLIGHDRAGRTVVLPKDENDVEGMKAFRSKLGVPESPDKYELPLPAGDTGELAKAASQWMFDAGVPKGAAQKVAQQWNDHIAGMIAKSEQETQQKSEQELSTLKAQWGNDFSKNEELARRGFRDAGQRAGWSDEDSKAFESSVGTAKMLKMFVELGKANAEPAFAGEGGGGGNFGMSKATAQTKLSDINAKRAAGEITDKQWKDTYEAEVERLAQIAYAT